MKVAHHALRYLPETVDGIVIFIKSLIEKLENFGIENTVVAPVHGTEEMRYSQAKTEVYRYPYISAQQNKQNKIAQPACKTANYGDIPSNEGLRAWIEPHWGIEHFASWLKQQQFDIYHLHNWKPSCGLSHLRTAKKLGLKSVVTLHSPAPVCFRVTMMLNGQEPCDGRIEVKRCRNCCNSSFPAWVNQAWSYIPETWSIKLPASPLTNALNNATLVDYRRKALVDMATLADRITVPCQWLYDALLLNGLPEEKIILCRHGVADSGSTVPSRLTDVNKPLKIGYLGRWTQTKGLNVLIQAVQNLPPDVSVKLVVHAFAHLEREKAFREQILSSLAQNDGRIEIAEPLPREQIAEAMADFDLLAVPSQWLETGPLVVLEAHGAGTPVLGSDMGGIAELVRHGIDGWLIPQHEVRSRTAWGDAIAHLAKNPDLVANFRCNIQPVRTFERVAQDYKDIYHQILGC